MMTMTTLYMTAEHETWFDTSHIADCAAAALKQTQTWLTKESIRRLGRELRIRSSCGRRRVRSGKIRGNKTQVWFGLMPLNLAYIRDYEQMKTGVKSGHKFYKGTFVRSMNNSPLLIWRRTRDRPRQPKPRRKPLPKGRRRKRKAPPVAVVREDLQFESVEIIEQLQTEIQDVYREAFLDELHRQSG